MCTIPKYHGTDRATAQTLQAGAISPAHGGGELGQGFYVGDKLWVAKAWAHNRHGTTGAVLEIKVPEANFFSLSLAVLSRTEAIKHRNSIRATGTTRTHLFGFDVVWSPIVGSTRVDADQYKYESSTSVSLLNGSACQRNLR